MKKLKLIGLKYNSGKFVGEPQSVGEVYVENGRVKVNSPYQDLADGLLREIEKAAYTTGALISPSREEPGTRHKADDPRFLEALTYSDIWDKLFGGWRIDEMRSEIVEE